MSNVVYIIGAGFSAGLGFPLTNNMLRYIWDGFDADSQVKLEKIIKFHNQSFKADDILSHPDIETLLTQLDTNLALFHHTRFIDGQFGKEDLSDIKKKILLQITNKFHDQQKFIFKNLESKETSDYKWLLQFKKMARSQNATIISFNYDLILEELFYANRLSPSSYGFGNKKVKNRILKPHGSLNWFLENKGMPTIKSDRKERIAASSDDEDVYIFKRYRSPKSKHLGFDYIPHIIPPTFIKNFDGPIYKTTMQNCVSAISSAREVVFMGYSLPDSDFYAKFMLRCGFHNQDEGEILKLGRGDGIVNSKVVVVNPSADAARKFKDIVSSRSEFEWFPGTVADWMSSRT